jgi:hypothetical protein
MPRAASVAETTPLLRQESDGGGGGRMSEEEERGGALSAVLQPWVGYVLVAYTGMAVQVALAPDEFLTRASPETLAFDGLRVALASALWISLTVALWKLNCWPQWFLDKRVGKPGKEAMPATIVVSFIHASAAVGAGAALLAPSVARGEWEWYKPMTGSIATYVSRVGPASACTGWGEAWC